MMSAMKVMLWLFLKSLPLLAQRSRPVQEPLTRRFDVDDLLRGIGGKDHHSPFCQRHIVFDPHAQSVEMRGEVGRRRDIDTRFDRDDVAIGQSAISDVSPAWLDRSRVTPCRYHHGGSRDDSRMIAIVAVAVVQVGSKVMRDVMGVLNRQSLDHITGTESTHQSLALHVAG